MSRKMLRMKLKPCIFITGSAKRIGRAIAQHFATIGYDIVIHYNNSKNEAFQLVNELSEQRCNAKAVCGALDKPSAIEGLFQEALQCFGKIDVLVNSASTFTYDNIDTVNYETWNKQLDTNLWAPFRLSQLFAANNQSTNANIINITDQRVQNLTPHFMSYTVSKCGLWTITQTLAMALAPKIRVNSIAPGPVLGNDFQSPGEFEKQYKKTPLRRKVDTSEIAEMIESIIRTKSMTGQLITIDSGQHLGWTFPTKKSKFDME